MGRNHWKTSAGKIDADSMQETSFSIILWQRICITKYITKKTKEDLYRARKADGKLARIRGLKGRTLKPYLRDDIKNDALNKSLK